MKASGAKQASKQKLLYLLQILKEESDELHPLSASELCRRLESFGISCERKSIYRDLAVLNDFGYDVVFTRSPSQGYFLGQRELEVPEIRLLLDAITTAPFITEKKTRELTEKLCSVISKNQRQSVVSQMWRTGACGRVKFDNEEVYYTIDAIHQAIASQKKIRFTYFHRSIVDGTVKTNPGREFCISPYAMLWNEDKYYLVGNYEKYDNLSNYRIDRMRHVTIVDEQVRPLCQVSPYETYFDTADYVKTSFSMYHGTEQTVRFSCEEALLETMLDKFGQLEILEQQGDKFLFEATVQCGEGFFDWILRWGGRLVVLEPEEVRQTVMKKIRTLSDSYGMGTLGKEQVGDENFNPDSD